MALNQHEAIKQAVRAGLGLGCLSQLCVAEEIARGELVALASDLPLSRSFSLVWHPQRYRSPLWQAFKVFLGEAERTKRNPSRRRREGFAGAAGRLSPRP